MGSTRRNPRVLVVTPEVTYLPDRMGSLASFFTAFATLDAALELASRSVDRVLPVEADDVTQAVFCALARKAPELLAQGVSLCLPACGSK